jgi:LuxR family maltose regulon positive regulatory protein
MIEIVTASSSVEELLLLQSKWGVPPVVPDVLPREQLFGRLDGWPSRRLTYVQGAPGFGKTMLATSWLHARRRQHEKAGARVAWLGLDEGDNDPRLFLAYLAAALQPILPEAATAVTQNLRREQLAPRRVMTILLNGIARHGDPLLLVLDDYQHIGNEQIHQAVRSALEQGPPNLHLMLLSRQGPPSALGPLGTLAGIAILDTDDLRFGEAEIGRYVQEILGWDAPSEHELSLLAERSDGWITGLKLAAIQLPATGDVEAFAAALQGENQWLSRFFVSEFLDTLPRRLQTFLLQTSLLERLSAPLCAAVTGRADAGALLQEAAAGGFFLSPIDSRGLHFAYHDLFRELLVAELQRRCTAPEVAELHTRAAICLEEDGNLDVALRHYLAAGRVCEAVALVEQHALPTILGGDVDRARRWLARLQEHEVALSPRLLLDQAWIYLMADRVETLQLLQSTQAAWDRLIAQEAQPAEMQTERLLQVAFAQHLAGNYREVEGLIADLGSRISAQSHFLVHGLWHGLQSINRTAKPEVARGHGLKALAIFEEHGWTTGMISSLRGLTLVARVSGDAQEALALGRRALRLAKISRQDQTLEAIYIHRQLANILYELNRLDEAVAELRNLTAKAELLGEAQWTVWGRIMLNLCDVAGGRNPSFPAELDLVTKDAAVLDASPLFLDTLRQMTIRCWVMMGETTNAWAVARQHPVRPGDSLPDYRPLTLIDYLSGTLAHREDPSPIESVLEALELMTREMGVREYQLQTQLLYAWYWLKRGDKTAAGLYLMQALDIVSQTGYVRTLLDVPELRPLLAAIDHPALLQFPVLTAVPEQEASRIDLTDQEVVVLRLLGERCSNAEISERLVVTEGTVKWHLHNIYGKLGVKNRRAAVARARVLGYLG